MGFFSPQNAFQWVAFLCIMALVVLGWYHVKTMPIQGLVSFDDQSRQSFRAGTYTLNTFSAQQSGRHRVTYRVVASLPPSYFASQVVHQGRVLQGIQESTGQGVVFGQSGRARQQNTFVQEVQGVAQLQRGELLELNVVFEGEGEAFVESELLVTPL